MVSARSCARCVSVTAYDECVPHAPVTLSAAHDAGRRALSTPRCHLTSLLAGRALSRRRCESRHCVRPTFAPVSDPPRLSMIRRKAARLGVTGLAVQRHAFADHPPPWVVIRGSLPISSDRSTPRSRATHSDQVGRRSHPSQRVRIRRVNQRGTRGFAQAGSSRIVG
jgi:hypothetical protein